MACLCDTSTSEGEQCTRRTFLHSSGIRGTAIAAVLVSSKPWTVRE